MPKLPTYTAPGFEAPISGGRRATAEDFSTAVSGAGEAAAGMIGAGRAIQDAAKAHLAEMEDREARTALVQSTEIRARYARELDAAVLSGADLDKIKDKMRDDLTKVGADFQTQRGADQLQLYSANSEIMYDEQANRINVQRAYSAAKLDAQKFLVESSKLIQSNPAYLEVASQNAEEFAATLRGVSPEKRAEIVDGLRKDLNMAAAISASRLDPAGTKKRLEAGEWDLTPEQRNVALNKADTEMRAARADEAYQRELKDREKRDRDEAARDQLFKGIIDGKVNRRSIMDNPDLRAATREHLITFMEQRAKSLAGQERASDPRVKRDLWLAIHAPDGDPTKIYTGEAIIKAVLDHKLNPNDANQLIALVAQQKDVNGRAFGTRLRERMTVLSRAMNDSPEYKAQPELAAAIQMRLAAEVERQGEEMRRAGKSPDVLLDPDSKEYFFKPGVLKATAAAIREEQMSLLRGKVPDLRTLNGAGTRPDGTMKGLGFFGALPRPDGKVLTELSIGVEIDGKETLIPALVPTLSKSEVDTLLRMDPKDRMPDSIVEKAAAHARKRLKEGKPVFATIDESIPVGSRFIDPKGTERIMTKELLDALKKQASPARQTVSGPITRPKQ